MTLPSSLSPKLPSLLSLTLAPPPSPTLPPLLSPLSSFSSSLPSLPSFLFSFSPRRPPRVIYLPSILFLLLSSLLLPSSFFSILPLTFLPWFHSSFSFSSYIFLFLFFPLPLPLMPTGILLHSCTSLLHPLHLSPLPPPPSQHAFKWNNQLATTPFNLSSLPYWPFAECL